MEENTFGDGIPVLGLCSEDGFEDTDTEYVDVEVLDGREVRELISDARIVEYSGLYEPLI